MKTREKEISPLQRGIAGEYFVAGNVIALLGHEEQECPQRPALH
jgi:hypothetical protein